jgi:hypothetical protein
VFVCILPSRHGPGSVSARLYGTTPQVLKSHLVLVPPLKVLQSHLVVEGGHPVTRSLGSKLGFCPAWSSQHL